MPRSGDDLEHAGGLFEEPRREYEHAGGLFASPRREPAAARTVADLAQTFYGAPEAPDDGKRRGFYCDVAGVRVWLR